MRWTNGDFLSQLKILTGFKGQFLQLIKTYDQGISLLFWSSDSGKSLWYFDLNAKTPGFYQVPNQHKISLRPHKQPIELFLNSHFKNKMLIDIEWEKQFGRVLQLHFSDKKQIELRLFPHGVNLGAFAEDKKIYWKKPVPLQPMAEFHEAEPQFVGKLSLVDLWTSRFEKKLGKREVKSAVELKIAKLEKVKQSLTNADNSKKENAWRQLGFDLQLGKSADLPSPENTLQWNIDHCFTKAKQEQINRETRRKRIVALEGEINKLQSEGLKNNSAKSTPDLFKLSDGKGQVVHLSSGHKIYFGKNAADNIKLLRKSSPWHQWFHIKDQPGSHGILVKNKKETLSQGVLQLAAKELLKFSFRSQLEKQKGQKFEVLTTECRYVKPIKGDKLGRVTHSCALTLLVVID